MSIVVGFIVETDLADDCPEEDLRAYVDSFMSALKAVPHTMTVCVESLTDDAIEEAPDLGPLIAMPTGSPFQP